MTTPSETRAGKLPDPAAVLYPDSGFRQDEHAIELWQAHQYDTGGEPFYSADQLHSYAAERVSLSRVDGEVLLEHSGCGYGTECNQIDVKLDRGDKVLLVKRNSKADTATHECVCQDEAVAQCTPYGPDCLYGKPKALAASDPKCTGNMCTEYLTHGSHAPDCELAASEPEGPHWGNVPGLDDDEDDADRARDASEPVEADAVVERMSVEDIVTDELIVSLLPSALLFADSGEHLVHARKLAKTKLRAALTAALEGSDKP